MSQTILPQHYPAAQDTAGQSPTQTKYPTRAAALAEGIRRLQASVDDVRLVAVTDADPAAVVCVCRMSRLLAEWRGELAELEAAQ